MYTCVYLYMHVYVYIHAPPADVMAATFPVCTLPFFSTHDALSLRIINLLMCIYFAITIMIIIIYEVSTH